jgi:hypothetical protein
MIAAAKGIDQVIHCATRHTTKRDKLQVLWILPARMI